MTDELQLITDGDGVAVIGAPSVVERFLASEGLASRELELQRISPAIGRAAAATQAGAEIAAVPPPEPVRAPEPASQAAAEDAPLAPARKRTSARNSSPTRERKAAAPNSRHHDADS